MASAAALARPRDTNRKPRRASRREDLENRARALGRHLQNPVGGKATRGTPCGKTLQAAEVLAGGIPACGIKARPVTSAMLETDFFVI
jgi:hypothetical protein